MQCSLSRITLTIICVIFFCNQTLFAQEWNDLHHIFDSIGDKINRAAVEGDFETVLSFYAEDIVLMPGFKPTLNGKKAVKQEMEKDREKGLKFHSISGTITEIWSCGDLVYDRGTFGLSVSTKASSRPYAYYGSYFQIWQKQPDGSYKIKLNIWNLDFNPFEL
jgi:ketosteroid isomerase-like protein